MGAYRIGRIAYFVSQRIVCRNNDRTVTLGLRNWGGAMVITAVFGFRGTYNAMAVRNVHCRDVFTQAALRTGIFCAKRAPSSRAKADFPLVVVRRSIRGPHTQKVCRRNWSRDYLKTDRFLPVVETVADAGRARVLITVGGSAEQRQIERLLYEPLNAGELVLRVRNVVRLGVRRNDDARHAKTQAFEVELRRRRVVVPPAPLVPRDDDGRVVPVLTLANRVDDGGHPRWSEDRAAARVIGVRPIRRDP